MVRSAAEEKGRRLSNLCRIPCLRFHLQRVPALGRLRQRSACRVRLQACVLKIFGETKEQRLLCFSTGLSRCNVLHLNQLKHLRLILDLDQGSKSKHWNVAFVMNATPTNLANR